MLVRTFRALSIPCLFLICISAAQAADPFVGKWKMNQPKSRMTGERRKIEAIGGKKYRFTSGEISDTIVADGTDQPIHFGFTRAITEEGPNTWKLVDKKDGRTLGTGAWTLSQDGRTINVEVTGTLPDGSPFHEQATRKRIAGTSGFAGTWEDTSVKMGAPYEVEIHPYEGDGLTFFAPAYKDTLSIKFDGRDYEESGPYVPPGSTSAGHRVDERTLELTDKVQGKVMDTTVIKVSPDGKTLTYITHMKGQSKPLTFVCDKE